MKNKFNRYYFLNIQFSITMLFIHILMIVAPLSYLISGENINLILFFQICIILPLILSLIYICLGGYWIFQTLTINREGIEIWLFKKRLKKYSWSRISSIQESWHMRNPALKITLVNDDEVYLEKRKPIIRAIEYYSAIKIEKSTPPPPHFMKEYK